MLWDLVLDVMMNADEYEAPREIVFRYVAPADATTVSVVGQFNDWDRARLPMSRTMDGEWTATVNLAPGVYSYLFVVNNAKWLPDPNAPRLTDLNGNVNSQLIVTPSVYDAKPGKRGDGVITLEALRHSPTAKDTVRRSKTEWMLNCKTRAGDVEKVGVRFPDGKAKAMRRVASDALYETWQVVFSHPEDQPLRYQFELTDGTVRALAPAQPLEQDPRTYPLPSPPAWVRRSVFYQIFPERFANGNTKNDPVDVQPWGTPPAPRNFMGGDIAGIQKNLSHLQTLGVNALYLNPTFESPTNHAYDITDYMKVNPKFGTNDEFRELVKTAHAAEMRVMLDGVFNHSSVEHPFFQDVVKNEKKSKYVDWYTILKFPIEIRDGQQTYRGWAGVKHMPKLNTSNPDVQKYVNEVGAAWIRDYGIDAWRLDVANEVDPACWRSFRKAVRAEKSDAYILGEDWGDARSSLQGDQWDATMNYRWRMALLEVLAGRTHAKKFADELQALREQVPEAVFEVQFNLLGSHDTPRILTVLGGDKDKLRQATLFQMVYPGVACVYYGDEIGMEGGHDPDQRRCMIWNKRKWDRALYDFFRAAIGLRRELPELQSGSMRFIRAEARSGLLLLERKLKGRTAIFAMNLGKEAISLSAETTRGLEAKLAHLLTTNSSGDHQLAPKGCALFATP